MAPAERTEDAGLIVVGASLAGLIAAITAADHGHRVALVERSKDLGGLAATSAESIAAAGTRFQRVADVVDTTDGLLADLAATAGHPADPDLTRAVVEQGAALVEWLADRCGAQVVLQSTTATDRHSSPRLHGGGEQGGASLITVLARAASHHTHIRVRTATEVDRLVATDAGGVAGVALRPDRRGATSLRGPVVLACGGFVGDDDLVAQHCPTVAKLPYLGPAGAKGDALRLAAPLGPAVRHVAACAVTPLLAQPSHLAVSRAVIEHGGILVNQRGQRFTDESQASLPLALTVRAEPGRVAYLLFDERVAAAVSAHDPFFARVVLPRTSRRAGSTGMLAKQLELPETELRRTLETFNARPDGQTDAVGRQGGGSGLGEPLYGIRVTGGRRATLGGLAVDGRARVLDQAGNAIADLYAVGGAAAGLVADPNDGALTGIDTLAALALARLAALSLGPVADET
jgi:fumarate reductase flavoprotein subunit